MFASQRTFLLAFLFILFASMLNAQMPNFDPSRITIARDEWGTPHIFAPTDAEVAYGLAWANSEDNFDAMQEAVMVGKGLMGRYQGVKGAPVDFFAQTIGARELVEQEYDKIPKDFINYLWGYCAGVTAYAKKHKDKVKLKKLLPITPRDILTTYVVTFAALNDVSGAVSSIVEGKEDHKQLALGSNAFAMSSAKTADGRTYLCINPHFLVDGPLSFYEAHICSEEGLNMTGALFQGGTSVFMGSNKNLGWGMTYNHVDAVDVYRLERHPKKKKLYKYDGEWKELEKNHAKLKVKVKGITIPVKRKAWRSVHGPVYESPDGQLYAVRAPSMNTVKSPEQFYRMNKAKNWKEFKAALDMQGVSMFNIVYADRDDNIYYVCNARVYERDRKYDGVNLLPGNKSEVNWDRIYPMDELPHVFNPSCGYVFNTNNTPFNATCPEENDDPNRLPRYVDKRNGDNNRSERLMEMVNEKDRLDFKDFRAIKFDRRYPKDGKFLRSLDPLMNLKPEENPDIAEGLKLIQEWDREADPESKGAAFLEVAMTYIFDQMGYGDDKFIFGIDNVSIDMFKKGVKYAQDYLMERFGTVHVPLKKVHLFYRDGKGYYTQGFADVLMASYALPEKDGTLKVKYGDSFTQLVAFSKENGAEEIESVLPYSVSWPSETYKSQLELYNQLGTKTMSLKKEEVIKRAAKVYSPE